MNPKQKNGFGIPDFFSIFVRLKATRLKKGADS